MSSEDYNVVIDVDDEGDLGDLEFNQDLEFHRSSKLSSSSAAAIAKKQISIMKLAEKFHNLKLAGVRTAKPLYLTTGLISRYRALRRILQQSIRCPQQRF